MVKARDINKDIKAIAKKVKTAVFSYDEVHNKNVKNVFHYDYELVINRVAEANGWDREEALKQLKDCDILSPLPNGEYKVEVGTSTKGGGGLNYHGLAFFTLSQDDYRTKYHELAHSLQKEYKLFDKQKVDKLYHVSSQGIPEDKIDDKQIDEYNYKLYLNEMHSESFSYAAMMLRAENPIDFFRQAYNAYNTARMSNMAGFFSFGKTDYGGDNNNTKFYSTFPVMKETIKTIRKMRKMGKTKDFFDENGVLKDEKLAKLCEQIVVKSAYSPRTLNSFFKYRILDDHNDNEHGWRKDTLKGVAAAVYSPFIMLANEGNVFSSFKSILNHHNMEMNEKETIRQMTMPRRTFDDQETQALYNFIQYNRQCSEIASRYKGNFVNSDYLMSYCSSVLREEDKKIHTPSIRDQARIVMSEFSTRKQERLGNEMIALATFAQNQKDNPYFCHLIEKRVELADVIKMYNEKLKHPEKAQIESPEPIKSYQKKENERSAYNGVRRPLFRIRDFAKDTKCSDMFKQALVNIAFKDCETIDNPQVRKSLAQSVQFKFDIFGIRKRKFTKKLNRTLDSISMEVRGQRNNLSYDQIKKQYECQNLEDILDDTKKKMQEFNKNAQKSKEQPAEEEQNFDYKAMATNVVNNNLEAANYLADRYGLSDRLRLQLQKMAVMPIEKQENTELRKAFADVVHFEGDWLGKEKRSFKKDLDQLMYGFICDACRIDNLQYQSAYQTACRQKMEELRQGTAKVVSITPQENMNETRNTLHQQATEKDEKKVVEVEKTPKEQVIDKLKSWGIEDGTYLILTPEDNAFKSFGTNETRSVQSYFEEGKKDIKETDASVVYGTNNGLVGAYFAEGVYVVSNNDEMRDVLYRKGKDVGFGVLLSNGERFNHEDGTANTELNAAWKLAHRKAEKANEKAEKAAQERKALKEQQTAVKIDINEGNGAQKVCAMLQKISEVADRNDTSGQLKDKLVKAYVENSEQMLTLEFWGDCAKAFADRSPQKKSAFVQELGQLGLEIGKDIKQNKDDTQYQAVKKRCADCEKTDDVIKTATACAKRTHTSVNGSLDKAASR